MDCPAGREHLSDVKKHKLKAAKLSLGASRRSITKILKLNVSNWSGVGPVFVRVRTISTTSPKS
jgi:hypothetical protein